jgi:hypothetical protein
MCKSCEKSRYDGRLVKHVHFLVPSSSSYVLESLRETRLSQYQFRVKRFDGRNGVILGHNQETATPFGEGLLY